MSLTLRLVKGSALTYQEGDDNFIYLNNRINQVTGSIINSIGLTAPTGFSVSNSPITSSGNIGLSFASGYSLPTTSSQTNWDTAYTNRITSLTTIGSSGSATLISNTLNIPTYTLSGLGGVGGSGTTNELSYWSGSSTLGSLSTTTYPSLTELSYVKGVTSSIQTQLNAKVSSQWITSGSNIYYSTGGVSIGTSTAPTGKLYVLGSPASNEVARFASEASANQVYLQGAHATPTISRNTIFLLQSRGSLASPASVASGDYLGSIIAGGYQDSFYSKASLDWIVDNTVTSSTIPTALVFSASATSANRAEVMRLSSAGNLLLGNTTGTDKLTITGNVNLNTAGNKLKIATGSNASIGTSSAMVAGTTTVNTTAVTASSKIFLIHKTIGGTIGTLSVGTITAGTSFVINSNSALDTSTVDWLIIN